MECEGGSCSRRMALRKTLSAPKRRSAACLFAAGFYVAVAMMFDTMSFLGTPVSRPRAVTQVPGPIVASPCLGSGHRLPSQQNWASASWFCAMPLAVCSLASALRSRHVRRLFGLGGKEKTEELSEKAKEACEKLQEEIEELKTLAEDKRASHERLKLETSNFRARTRAELATARGKAAVPIVKELLPIADEYELAKQNIKVESDGEKAIVSRFDGLFSKMLDSWKALGVEKLESVGQEFNPEFHEAVSMIPSEEYVTDVVCNELRAGWVLKAVGSDEPQVLRPSLVCVSAGPGPS